MYGFKKWSYSKSIEFYSFKSWVGCAEFCGADVRVWSVNLKLKPKI